MEWDTQPPPLIHSQPHFRPFLSHSFHPYIQQSVLFHPILKIQNIRISSHPSLPPGFFIPLFLLVSSSLSSSWFLHPSLPPGFFVPHSLTQRTNFLQESNHDLFPFPESNDFLFFRTKNYIFWENKNENLLIYIFHTTFQRFPPIPLNTLQKDTIEWNIQCNKIWLEYHHQKTEHQVFMTSTERNFSSSYSFTRLPKTYPSFLLFTYTKKCEHSRIRNPAKRVKCEQLLRWQTHPLLWLFCRGRCT